MGVRRKIDLAHPQRSVLAEAARVIRSGGLIVYPTETLYGIGANAVDANAVRRVSEAKKRKEAKPIPLIVHSREVLEVLVERISPSAEALMKAFWPGPLTLVFLSSSRVPDEVTKGSGTVGVRIPSSTLCLELLAQCGGPLTATSANISGETVLRTVPEIREALSSGVNLYLDAGELPLSMPSTVLDVAGDVPRLLRDGAVPIEQILQVVPNVER